MADTQPDIVVAATDWSDIGYQIFNGFLKRFVESKAGESIPGTVAEGAILARHAVFEGLVVFATLMGKTLLAVEEPMQPLIAGFVAPVIQGLFGAPVDAAALGKTLTADQAQAAGRAIVDGFLKAIVGDAGGEVEPSTDGSTRMAAAAVSASLHSVINAVLPEMLSDCLGEFGPSFTALTEIPEEILRTLGVSRLVRRALGPFVTATCTTPATWALNKKYRPTLLGASTLAKQITRNPDFAERWKEDLRRDGYSEDRIAALLNEQRHFFSAAEVRTFTYRNEWSEDAGLQHLRDQGYDEKAATYALRLEGIHRIEQLESAESAAIIAGYVRGDIDRADLLAMLGTSVSVQTERTLLTEEADVRRAANPSRLTLSQIEAMVKSGVLSLADYRARAVELNYPDDEINALDLQLRWEISKERDLAALRDEQAKERAAAKAAADLARQQKLAAVAAQRALDRRGSEADLEAAAIRGLIPLARVEEVYRAKYDPDTVDALLGTLADKRTAYVAQQQAADDAKRRAAVRNIDVGSLQQAVLTHLLTLDEFRQRLVELKFSADDAALLAATMAARLQALDAARTQRDEASAAAKIKHIDLKSFELLVRRGHRTLRDYDALLASLGYEDGSRAAMEELLQLQIDDDAAAAKLRAAKTAAAAVKGLTLDQMRRAVILKLRPITDYTPFLLQLGYTTPEAQLLVAELQADVDEAAAATARRDAADRRSQAPRAPLADVRRAARLGLIDIPVYVARMKADGYTDDDVAIELDLLTTEIAQLQQQQAAAAAADAASGQKGLTLAQLAAAVLAGVQPIGAYTARAAAIGLSPADAQTLTATLQAQLDTTAAARARKAQLAAEGADRELRRADVEKGVRDGLKTIDDYRAWLQGAGYADDDAALLVAELQIALDGAGGTPPGA